MAGMLGHPSLVMGRNVVPFALGALLVLLLMVPNGREIAMSGMEGVWVFVKEAVDAFFGDSA